MEYGLEKILTDIIPTYIKRHWSEGSINALVVEFGSDDKRANLAMAILEGRSVADAGYTFVRDVTPLRVIHH